MNKISFTIPIQNKDKIVSNNQLEITNETTNIIIKPKIINITNYKKLAPNVYMFCNNIK